MPTGAEEGVVLCEEADLTLELLNGGRGQSRPSEPGGLAAVLSALGDGRGLEFSCRTDEGVARVGVPLPFCDVEGADAGWVDVIAPAQEGERFGRVDSLLLLAEGLAGEVIQAAVGDLQVQLGAPDLELHAANYGVIERKHDGASVIEKRAQVGPLAGEALPKRCRLESSAVGSRALTSTRIAAHSAPVKSRHRRERRESEDMRPTSFTTTSWSKTSTRSWKCWRSAVHNLLSTLLCSERPDISRRIMLLPWVGGSCGPSWPRARDHCPLEA